MLYTGAKSDSAAALLSRIETGAEEAATSALTLDEIAWIVGRHAARDVAIKHARLVLALPHLRIVPVREAEIRAALDLMDAHRKLSPRDAVHAACAIGAGIHTIVSDDADFDTVGGLDRRPLA